MYGRVNRNNYMVSANLQCKYCLNRHLPNQKCQIACRYCHSFHLKTELVDGVCPKMVHRAKKIRPSSNLTCKQCQGEGKLEKSIQIKYLEKLSRYESRLLEFMNKAENKGGEPPERKVVKIQHKFEEYVCTLCKGLGYIHKVINCCTLGCELCNNQRCLLNPIWLEYKIKDYMSTCSGLFSCSFCRLEIKNGSRYFSLPCEHLFHKNCYEQYCWECPICQNLVEEKPKPFEIQVNMQKFSEAGSFNEPRSCIEQDNQLVYSFLASAIDNDSEF